MSNISCSPNKKGAPCAPNLKDAHKGELTLRTSVITYGSKGELAIRGTRA